MILECKDLKIINKYLSFFETKIVEISPFQKFLLFYEDKVDVGFLDYSIMYDRAEINYIYVDKNYRNKEVATLLINKLIEILNEKDCKNISLEVNESNDIAISFYKKHLFSCEAVRKNYYDDADALLMIRELV